MIYIPVTVVIVLCFSMFAFGLAVGNFIHVVIKLLIEIIDP